MHKMLKTAISRRSMLKLSAISGVLLASPMWMTNSAAQSASNVPVKVVDARPDGMVSFNAGWVIPLEDKPALLALEEKKIKEAQAASSAGGSANNSAVDASSKPAKKSWGDKAQDVWNKVRSIF